MLTLIDEMALIGVRSVILSGGEPLCHPDFFTIAECLVQRKIAIQLATNATLITNEMADRLAGLGVSAHVSLDGPDSETYGLMRGDTCAFALVVAGVRRLVKRDVPVTIACCATSYNAGKIPRIVEFAEQLGARRFRLLPFVPAGRGAENALMEVPKTDMREIAWWLVQQRPHRSIEIAKVEFECLLSPPSGKALPGARMYCRGGLGFAVITEDGRVLPCDFFREIPGPSVKEHTLWDIWHTDPFLRWFRDLSVDEFEGCKNCDWGSACAGGCIASNFVKGNLLGKNARCWLSET
jgi:radical SAM protein with 4Fe4S-binding SPASM domain